MDDRTAATSPARDRAVGRRRSPLRRRSGGWLSPINQRRWQNFKANRRGYVSLWVFAVLFVLSLCAEFIANDRPLMIRYRGPHLFPGVRDLSGDGVRRRVRDRGRLSRSLSAQADRGEGRHRDLAADPLFLQHAQSRSADAGAVAADLDADGGAVQAGGRRRRA